MQSSKTKDFTSRSDESELTNLMAAADVREEQKDGNRQKEMDRRGEKSPKPRPAIHIQRVQEEEEEEEEEEGGMAGGRDLAACQQQGKKEGACEVALVLSLKPWLRRFPAALTEPLGGMSPPAVDTLAEGPGSLADHKVGPLPCFALARSRCGAGWGRYRRRKDGGGGRKRKRQKKLT
ncbi:hypothetical protein EYF80_030843 [Liparis tanakae]|uniref:Uncharacterized protein n=1 Tax=Liparis tanakae TaxID=230148 RepID=A0A4Z2H0B0_9TELE|nr:hypothetical protein EYF80_030843 [Liparis tanakae]